VTTAAVSEAATLFTGLRNADAQITVPHAASIEHFNGFLRLSLIAHFHKSKAF
jgi:hypothetical protein